MKHKTHKKTT